MHPVGTAAVDVGEGGSARTATTTARPDALRRSGRDEPVSRSIDEFESSGFWQSGYVDSDGNAHEFDHAQDYEDAVGHIVSQMMADQQSGRHASVAQRQFARNTIADANDGDHIELDLGDRHYFVREIGTKQTSPTTSKSIRSRVSRSKRAT